MPATLIISFDFEIGWGDVTNERWRARQSRGTYEALRKVLPDLLQCFRRHEVPATWATVGAMFDEPSNRDFSHLPREAQSVVEGALVEASASSFDGRDLFDRLISQGDLHAVVSHSYSHVPFGYRNMTDDAVEADLHRFGTALARFDLTTDALVFPENQEGSWSSLERCGYRLARVSPTNRSQPRIKRLVSAVTEPPPMSIERKQPGCSVVRHSGSMLFNSGVGRRHRLPLVSRLADSGLREAVKTGGTLHVWAHPFNFAESAGLLAAMDSFLGHAAELRDKELLTIRHM